MYRYIILKCILIKLPIKLCKEKFIIESVDCISKDERGFPLTQYITNGRISRAA